VKCPGDDRAPSIGDASVQDAPGVQRGGERDDMKTRMMGSVLPGAALAWALSGNLAAAPVDACSPALSDTHVARGFEVQTVCDARAETLKRLAAALTRSAASTGLSSAQRTTLATAVNEMLRAAQAQSAHPERSASARFDNVAPLIEALAARFATHPDMDPIAEARQWGERYRALLRGTSITRSPDPRELEIDDALERIDLNGAASLLSAQLAEKQASGTMHATRLYEAAVIELLRFAPQTALKYLQLAFVLQPDDTDIATAYGDTLHALQQDDMAETVYRALLAREHSLAEDDATQWQPQIARTFDKLGQVYIALKEPEPAEGAYLHALEAYWSLAQSDPETYGPAVAATFDNLGILYRDAHRLKDAADAYGEAVKLDLALAAHDPDTYRPDAAKTLNDLGILYDATQRTSDAEKAYRQALEIQRELVRENPAAYRPALARTLNNLGNLYSGMQRLPAAERAYREALTIRQQLARETPARYRPDLARTLSNLGVLYRIEQRPQQAQQAYLDALQIYQSLAREDPVAYQPDEARTLNNLGVLFSRTNRPREAEDAYRHALGLYRGLARVDPVSYRQDEARTLDNLSRLYSQTQRPHAAQRTKREATRLQDAAGAQSQDQ
jgi:Flp pilus assembly protein TadD